MAYSSVECKKEILDWFYTKPHIKTIIDVGCGSGTYPKLLEGTGNKYEWIGVEIWKPYVTKYSLWEIYDQILVGNILDFLELTKYLEADCIIFGDVLEHMTKEHAQKCIDWADANFQHVVISTPINYEQGEVDGNPYEKHLSVWSMEELNSMVPGSFKIRGLSWDIAIFIK